MEKDIQVDVFEPCIGKQLEITASDENETFELELAETKLLTHSYSEKRKGFSLLFKNKTGKNFDQGTYQIKLPDMDAPFSVFLVPVAVDSENSYMEAIFN